MIPAAPALSPAPAPRRALPADAAALRHALDLTNTLLEAVSMEEPAQALVSKIGMLCRGTSVVYDAEGRIVASAGEAPTQLIWNEIAASNVASLAFPIGRWEVRTRTVGLHDGVHVLAIATRNHELLATDGELLLDTAERMLGAVNGIQHGASLRDRRDNEHLIATLQDGVLPSREHRFWSRLAQFAFPGYLPLRAFDAAAAGGGSVTEQDAQWTLDSARAHGVPLLLTVRRLDQDSPATINGLVPETERSAGWLERVAHTFSVGASAPFGALAETPGAFREAELALGIARQRLAASPGAAGTELIRLDRVDLCTWVGSQVDPRQLAARVAETLEPIAGNQALRETLVTYLALNQHVGATAEALFLHANTVRYRIAQVEERYGQPMSSAALVTNLTLALHDEILGRRRALS